MTSRLRSISGKVERSVRVAVIFKFTEVAILSTRILSQISRLTIRKETFGCICILYLDGRKHFKEGSLDLSIARSNHHVLGMS